MVEEEKKQATAETATTTASKVMNNNNSETDEETMLRERLKAKQRERRLSNHSDGDKDNNDKAAGSTTENEKKKKKSDGDNNTAPKNEATSNNKSPSDHNRAARSRSRENNRSSRRGGSNSRDRRSNSHSRSGGSRGRVPGRRNHRGPPHPPPPGWNHRGGPPPPAAAAMVDPYGRVPPGSLPAYPPRGGGGGYGPPPPPHAPHRGGGYGDRRGGPPPLDFYDQDQFGRAPPARYNSPYRRGSGSGHRRSSRSPSYSSHSSHSTVSSAGSSRRSRSRSLSHDDERSDDHHSDHGGGGRHHPRKRRRRGGRGRSSSGRRGGTSRRSRSPSTSGSSVSSSSSSSSTSSDESEDENNKKNSTDYTLNKDQRTVFVNQLVMRTTSKEIRRYFRRTVGAKVNEVILLLDRRTGKHKGCAYVEMKTMDDVNKALNVSGQPPTFQRFPILIKPSEAEKNYLLASGSSTATATGPSAAAPPAPIVGPNGELMESQKVYVGSLGPSITKDHLYKIFCQFGELTKVSLQMDPATGVSKGFAFLSFRDPKCANLAIQTMSNQVLGGRCMKTGWATQQMASAPGIQVVTSDEFPEDASERAQKAHVVLSQMSIIGAGLQMPATTAVMSPAAATPAYTMIGQQPPAVSPAVMAATASKVPTVAEARQNLATTAANMAPAAAAAAILASPDAKIIKGADNPTRHLLVHNMYDKDEETEPGWADEIKMEFQEECSKYGPIERVTVMSKEPGGKIYASFETIEAAKTCASSLAGRWFDKRQLRVEYVSEDQLPPPPKEEEEEEKASSA